MTQALYIETAKAEEAFKVKGSRRLNVSGVLKILGVSRNGYYSFKNREPSENQLKKEMILEEILNIYEDSYQNYGAPKITQVLHERGFDIVEKTVGNYMRQLGIKAQYIKPYTKTTTDSNFSEDLKNILSGDFNPTEPDAAWCSDITYIWTFTGFVYLTSIMDLFSRKIVSWVLSDTLETKWVIEAIEKAKRIREVYKPLVLHSDRGVQYTCGSYLNATAGLITSYSKKAYPWDNACMESFHALLKREWINRFKIFDYNHAYRLVFEYIETFYNTIRIHSHCGYQSPDIFEENYILEMEKQSKKTG